MSGLMDILTLVLIGVLAPFSWWLVQKFVGGVIKKLEELLKGQQEDRTKFGEFKGEIRGQMSILRERINLQSKDIESHSKEIEDLKKKVSQSNN